MRRAGDLEDLHRLVRLEQTHGFRIQPVYQMHASAHERVMPRGGIVDGDRFDGVDECAIASPVVRISLGEAAYARLERVEDEGARSDSVVERAALRPDAQLVHGQQVGQVGIRAVQRDRHLVFVARLDVGDRRDQRLCARFGILTAVVIERMHDVRGRELLAVVESHALADLEDPFGSAGLCLPALRQGRNELHFIVGLDQQVVELVAKHLNVGRGPASGVEAVGA
jgi:hypothetical protein